LEDHVYLAGMMFERLAAASLIFAPDLSADRTVQRGRTAVVIISNLWQTTPMKTSLNYPRYLEDRKALKLMERIKTQILQAKDSRNTALQADPKPQNAA
jgi:hypothetical protein